MIKPHAKDRPELNAVPSMSTSAAALVTWVVLLVPPMARAADVSHEVGRIKTKALRETSGIAASRSNPNVLWMHNDGETKYVYAIKTSGTPIGQLVVPVNVEDVEAIAIGPGPQEGVDYIYLGDIGDNSGRRREIRIVRFPEPALQAASVPPAAANPEVLALAYPDGPHNAEALMVDPLLGDLLVATKEADQTRIYLAPAERLRVDGAAELELLAKLEVELISAGDVSRDGTLMILRREDQGWLWTRSSEESWATALERDPEAVPVRGKKQGENGEAVAFLAVGTGYFTVSEGQKERIYAFDLPAGP